MKKLILILLLVPFLTFGQSGDCPNACITTGGSYLATSGGTAELNASNRGCLTTGEASSSYWFQVCFSSNGVFKFFINPNGNRNDFDFAIWNGVSCPPSGAPIRCSWAAVPPGGPCVLCDYTGLGTNPNTGVTAVDLSEGAFGDGFVAPINVVNGQCLTININNYGSGSSNFILNLTGTTATMSCLPLPIELVDFTCTAKTDYVFLEWETASETNSNLFEIQRSTDGINWIKIGTMMGAGTTPYPNFYSFNDYFPPQNEIYYRLKHIDNDGTYTYSPISTCSNNFPIAYKTKYYNLIGQEVEIESAVKGLYVRELVNGNHIKRDLIIK